jgi:hypothetical protein
MAPLVPPEEVEKNFDGPLDRLNGDIREPLQVAQTVTEKIVGRTKFDILRVKGDGLRIEIEGEQ